MWKQREEGIKRRGGEWGMAKWQRRRRKRRGIWVQTYRDFVIKKRQKPFCAKQSQLLTCTNHCQDKVTTLERKWTVQDDAQSGVVCGGTRFLHWRSLHWAADGMPRAGVSASMDRGRKSIPKTEMEQRQAKMQGYKRVCGVQEWQGAAHEVWLWNRVCRNQIGAKPKKLGI